VRFLLARREGLALIAGLGLLLAGIAANWLAAPFWLASGLLLTSLGIAGIPQALTALRALFAARRVTSGLLMVIAAVGAVLIGEYAEGAAVVVLFALGEALESFTMDRARASLHGLLQLAPEEALVLPPEQPSTQHSHALEFERRPARDVRIGERLLVRPGDRIALDGIVERGRSLVGQQHVTGESMPVERTVGDQVFAGSVNGDGTLEIRVSHAANDTLLSRIAALVAQAQAQRTPIERFVDRFAAVYTPAIVMVAVLVASVPTLAFGQPFWDTADGGHGWLYRALALLVIACPCALVLSTPASVVSALSAATRAGVLVRGGAVLEALRHVRVFAFDKTGTLTSGRVQVTQVACAQPDCDGDTCNHGDDILALAASLEAQSAHPLAVAVTSAAAHRQLAGRYGAAQDVVALPGRGIAGNVGGRRITIGNHALFDAEHAHDTRVCERVNAAETGGHTVMMVCSCDDGGVQGYIALQDSLRSESRTVVAGLRQAGIARTVMLTGDNAAVGATIAAAAGVDEARCGLLPAEKLKAVHELDHAYGPVAMVGDGINDTPALAAASVGIAMGAAGSAQALETADVALMQDDLTRLPFLVRLSRRTARTIRWNIAASLAAKLLFLALALGGVATLWLAVLADSGIALLVTLHGMRLLRERPDN
jgi:Cd2+/Zn2+-exporting ATPase